ncbi:Major facilitator superfamily domain general substrate transporter [Penicillium maclennaniae]|uniref:Major facilitator superfamily domain general substrate transporter n=1 Tax=Penicillium maclennaniae TaxID=1343394 RepID=UPI00254169A4|nr:Major facilitator superfamily domain general substrate transporter [Penicillium maclennaniae]KAJ5676836.1 Major facilitator superfamily domain general substrate transporter [Penicillium maclennaniae]
MSLFQKGLSAHATAFATRPRPITPRVQSPLRRVRQPRRHNSSHSKPEPAAEGKIVEDGLPMNNTTTGNSSQSTSPSSSSSQSFSVTPPAQPVNTAAGAAGAATSPATATAVTRRGLRDVISAGPLGRFGRWYSRVQERKPYSTQLYNPPPSAKGEQDASKDEDDKEERHGGYDPWRTVRHLIVGTGSSIPSYNWFMFLHNHFNYSSKILSVLTKVIVQQACFTPVFNTYFFSMHSLLAGASLEETWERLKKALPVSITNSVKLWPAVTAFSFMYVPAQFRNVFSGVIAVGWQTYLSWLNQKAAREVLAAELAATESMSCPLQGSQPDTPDSSDYGSDFTPDEEELLNELLSRAVAEPATVATPTPTSNSIFSVIEDSLTVSTPEPTDIEPLQTAILAALVADIEDGVEGPRGVRVPKVLGRESPRSPWKQSNERPWTRSTSNVMAGRSSQEAIHRYNPSVEHPSSKEGRERERERMATREREWTQNEQAAATVDPRSPVERFRRPPHKAFSVTDLVSPAWCELQYWYTLTKHGRKRRTSAMKKGSVVHKTLEDEIHTTIPVDITTKEDAWALRIWNVIQGLRMLREFGVTRELEIWGLVDGELVNGVIDQLSYECPESELEATASNYYSEAATSRAALPKYQMSLSDYLLSSSQGGKRLSDLGREESMVHAPAEESSPAVYNLPRIYMTDVKTKASGSVPSVKSTSFRPTLLQLQLYYHMLNRLITSDDVTMDLLAARYDLDQERPFTEAFISEVGGLNDEFFDTMSSQKFDIDSPPTPEDARRIAQGSEIGSSLQKSSQGSTSILATHSTLSSLWGYMKDQIRLTFLPSTPQTEPVAPSIPSHTQPELLAEYPTLLSPVLTARYLSSAPTADLERRVLGSRSFLYDPATMTSYIDDQMEWWRGSRDPRGVNIMDAWKCRICEFRDECSWRQERELDYARRNSRRASAFAA